MPPQRITRRDPATGRVLSKYLVGTKCKIVGCNRPVASRNWCKGHYKRWWHDGKPEEYHLTPYQKFWSRVKFTDDCWLWQGAKTKGYGSVTWAGGHRYAHRLSYEMLVGSIPKGLEIDHLCRTPACIRPDHLEPVTHRTNGLRGDNPPARNAVKTHCIHGHAFDEKNTHVDKHGYRSCRRCHADRERRRYRSGLRK